MQIFEVFKHVSKFKYQLGSFSSGLNNNSIKFVIKTKFESCFKMILKYCLYLCQHLSKLNKRTD